MSSLRPGDLFANRFEIDRIAGSGGMGTVYRARDQLTGGYVALKLLLGHRADGDAERFTREAQILAELRHPGIVSYVAHGQTYTGQRFLAMQWIEGEDLAQRLARGPLSLREALTLTGRIAEALAFAHERAIIHRDLKPTNLFLPDGDLDRVQILDFGIARRFAVSRAITRTGMILGTPEYMAPEQARGSRELTPAADLFSLGCVLYECLSGEPPFLAENMAAVLVRILFEEPVPVAQRRAGIPAALGELLGRLLTKDPAQRLGKSHELAEAIASLSAQTDLPSLATLRAGPRAPLPNPGSEQVLLSLVLALSPHEPAGSGAAVLPVDVQAELERHATLLAQLRALGAHADVMLGGALVATVPQMASAKDQAALAARCAAKVKEHWPEARVVVVTGRGSRSRGGLTGEVLDRAWRLVSPTERDTDPGSTSQIRVDEVSAGLLESHFDLAPLPPVTGAFALGGERLDPDAGRLLLGKPTPCVGRERDLSMLEAIYGECKEEQTIRSVLVLAPPGLGKSRLRHEFLRRLEVQGEQPLVLIGRGDPLKTRSAYGLLGEALRQRLELRAGQALAEQRARLRERVAARLPAADAFRVTVFIGEICGVPFPDEDSPMLHAARQDPRVMSEQVEQAWLDALRLLRSEVPLLLVLEDLHWSDALTVKLVDAALRRLRDLPLMVLALARPEVQELYPNLWAGRVQPLPLHPLPRKAGERLVRQILTPEVSPELVERIVTQSAGNPLFLEELIRASAEHKTGELPETVAAMLQARIGRLPAGTRRALRAASVFGEVFWASGVQSLLTATHGEDSVQGALGELIRHEIIEKTPERRFASEVQYRFRHALVRDAAYGLVSDEEKAAWHAAAGAFLESVGEPETVVLAAHFRIGQQLARAVSCYVRAAEQAFEAGDGDAALDCVEGGLACGAQGVEHATLLSVRVSIQFWREQFQEVLQVGQEAVQSLAPGSKHWCQVFNALLPAAILAQPQLLPGLMGAFLPVEPDAEARSSYVDAAAMLAMIFLSLGQKAVAAQLRQRTAQILKGLPQNDPAWCPFHLMESQYYRFEASDPSSALRHMQEMKQIALRIGNRQLWMSSRAYKGWDLLELGQRAAALSLHLEHYAAVQPLKAEMPRHMTEVYLGWVLVSGTDPEEWQRAEELGRRSLEGNSLLTLGLGHGVLARVAYLRGDLASAESEVRAALKDLEQLPPYRVDLIPVWSRILSAQGKEAESLQVCEQMTQELDTLGIDPHGLLALLVALAEAQARSGQHEAELRTLERALSVLRRRAAKVTNPDWRDSYLRQAPTSVRLLELAAQRGLDAADLVRPA